MYTHGFAGLVGGLGTGCSRRPGWDTEKGLVFGSAHLLGWQALTAIWVIVFTAVATYIILKIMGIFVPLRMTEEDMDRGRRRRPRPRGVPVGCSPLGFPHGAPVPGTAG